MKKIYIRRIEELERLLKTGQLESSNLQDGYDTIMELTIDDNGKMSIAFDGSRIYYRVPEIAKERMLFGVEQLITILGTYIPVYDKATGNILFSQENFDLIKSKMQGLSHYGSNEFNFSSNLDFPGIEEYVSQIANSIEDSNKKRGAIIGLLKEELAKKGITLGTGSEENCDVILLDIGSTGRGTNVPYDADFDFIARINPAIFDDQNKLMYLKTLMINTLGGNELDNLRNGQVREVNCSIPGIGDLKVDITCTSQAKAMEYTTELSLIDRLETMKKQDYDKYLKVVANIIFAKQLLKQYGAYKPSRSDRNQAGLGGVGLENLILQNGGSFFDASKEFLEHAEGKEFIDFEKTFPVFDFGKNHVSVEKKQFPYDNFVMRNMRLFGYEKTCQCMSDYVCKIETEMTFDESRERK